MPNRNHTVHMFNDIPDKGAPYTEQDSFDRNRHGSLFDRGSADSHYGRPAQPHWYPHGTGNPPRITTLTAAQKKEYLDGYEDNERNGDKKIWD